jgi:hypothetical protein
MKKEIYKNILHVFTEYEARDEYFNKVKSGNLVEKITVSNYFTYKMIRANNINHIFKVIKTDLDVKKLAGGRYSNVIYHQRPLKHEHIIRIESRVWKDPSKINIVLPVGFYFDDIISKVIAEGCGIFK